MIANGQRPGRREPQFESMLPEFEQAFREAMRDVYRGFYGDEIRADYQAGRTSPYLPAPRFVQSMGSGADYHYRSESAYMRMVERARLADRDNMIVGQGIDRLKANVFQTGFTLSPDTGDPALNQDLADRFGRPGESTGWSNEADRCDIEGERTFHELAQMAWRSALVDGDNFPILTSLGKIELVEGHRCRSPVPTRERLYNGVQTDEFNRRVGFYFAPPELTPTQAMTTRIPLQLAPARDARGNRVVLQLYQPKRMRQHRGVTTLAPSVLPVSYHDDLQFAMMVNAKVQSFYAVFRERELRSPNPRRDRQKGDRTTVAQAGGANVEFEQGKPGAEVVGDPGEKLTGFSPTTPHAEFFGHANLLLTIVAVNLDLPLAVLMLDPSQTNFSGWRGAMDQARTRFAQIQDCMIRGFYSPVYRWKVRNWLFADRVLRNAARRRGIDVFRHSWQPPGWSYIEPHRDALADDLRVTRNLASHSQREAERGRRWAGPNGTSAQIVADRATHVRNAVEEQKRLAAEGIDVDWRELADGKGTPAIQFTPVPLDESDKREGNER